MPWFKFYGGEYLSDPKMLALSPAERSCWITLLSYACVSADAGRIKHLTEERLMFAAGLDTSRQEWDETAGVLEKFEQLGMVLRDSNGDVTIKNWTKRQEAYLSSAERQRRYRERQKSNASVTQMFNESNARERDREKERNFSKEKGGENANAKSMKSVKEALKKKGLIK